MDQELLKSGNKNEIYQRSVRSMVMEQISTQINSHEEDVLSHWPVKLTTIKSAYVEPSSGSYSIYIKNKYPEMGLLCTQWHTPKEKYVITDAPKSILVFLSMLLNSDVAETYFKLHTDSKINLSSLKKFPTPAVSDLKYISGAVLESYLFVIGIHLDLLAENDSAYSSIQTVYSFLKLIRNYYVEELYIPDTYEALNVSIVDAWIDLLDFLPPVKSLDATPQILQSLLDIIVTNGGKLLLAYNKMKILQSDTSEAIIKKLSSL